MPRARHNIAVAVLVTTGTLGGGIALSRTLELGPYHTPQPTVSQALIDQRVEDLAEQHRCHRGLATDDSVHHPSVSAAGMNPE